MNDIIKDIEEVKIVKRCPKCNGLGLTYSKGGVKCNDCGYEENIQDIR